MSRWAFRVAGAVSMGKAPTLYWRDGAGDRATEKRLKGAAYAYSSTVTLDPDRTVMTPKRLRLEGTLEAETLDDAIQVALGTTRWTLVNVYGYDHTLVGRAFPLPPLDVRVSPVKATRQ